MGAMCGKEGLEEVDEDEPAESITSEAIAAAAIAAGPRTPADRPTLLVIWGGIGCGKSTATAAVLAKLGLDADAFVKVGVDDLIEYVPAFVADTESGDVERVQAAYTKYRDVARDSVELAITKAVKRKLNLMLEWTNEANLQAFASGDDPGAETDEWISEMKRSGHDVVVVLVHTADLEGIVANVMQRAEDADRNTNVHSRHIPEDIVRKFNIDRAKHFAEAVNKLKNGRFSEAGSISGGTLRAFVVMRPDASSDGELKEITGALPLGAGTMTEADAITAIADV